MNSIGCLQIESGSNFWMNEYFWYDFGWASRFWNNEALFQPINIREKSKVPIGDKWDFRSQVLKHQTICSPSSRKNPWIIIHFSLPYSAVKTKFNQQIGRERKLNACLTQKSKRLFEW
jgi:hypothetical protein